MSQNHRPQGTEIITQIQRLAENERFKDSDAIRRMLLQLGKQAAEHPGQTVKEYHLATEALGRSSDFDPKLDSAVRVVASRLRSRLAEYYAHEGGRDVIVVDLPRGSYALSCSYRSDPEANNISVKQIGDQSPRVELVWAAIATLVLIAVVATLSYYVGQGSISRSSPEPVRAFWKGLLGHGQPLIVYSNPAFQRTDSGFLRPLDPLAFRPPNSVGLYTGVGEVTAIHELTKQLTLLGYDSNVKRSQLFTWDEALKGDLIFVGGPEQSSAAAQLPKLEKFIFEPSTATTQAVVRNDKPSPGEQELYTPSKDLDNGVEYAIVAVPPGASSDHHVLILAGASTYGTEAAAMAVCNPTLLSNLFKRLNWRGERPIPRFEALLRLRVRGGAPLEPELLLVYLRNS